MSDTGRPTISVVIPAFNEERIIADCLDALAAQTDPVDEIVLVDNGCTDRTVEIAGRYPLVRVVAEPRKGITYARNAGFDAATGDVIARIDADSVAAPDWAATLRASFADPTVDAVAGLAGIAELSPGGRIWGRWHYRWFRHWHERSIGVRPMIYGFNGAFRRVAWLQAREHVTLDDLRISDDVDVTISLLRTGHRAVYNPRLLVKAHLLRSLKPAKLAQYYQTDGYTLAKHRFGNPRRWVDDPG